jgi:hypothetical protein
MSLYGSRWVAPVDTCHHHARLNPCTYERHVPIIWCQPGISTLCCQQMTITELCVTQGSSAVAATPWYDEDCFTDYGLASQLSSSSSSGSFAMSGLLESTSLQPRPLLPRLRGQPQLGGVQVWARPPSGRLQLRSTGRRPHALSPAKHAAAVRQRCTSQQPLTGELAVLQQWLSAAVPVHTSQQCSSALFIHCIPMRLTMVPDMVLSYAVHTSRQQCLQQMAPLSGCQLFGGQAQSIGLGRQWLRPWRVPSTRPCRITPGCTRQGIHKSTSCRNGHTSRRSSSSSSSKPQHTGAAAGSNPSWPRPSYPTWWPQGPSQQAKPAMQAPKLALLTAEVAAAVT